MAISLSDSHIVLNVKNSSTNDQNLFVSAFSGFVIIGTLESVNFSKRIVQISTKNLIELELELRDLNSFFTSNKDSSEPQKSGLGEYTWKGETANELKKVSYYKNELLLFTIDIEDLLSVTDCLSKVLIYTFLFKDLEISFFEFVLKDCSTGFCLENLQKNEKALDEYITNFIVQCKEQVSLNSKTILKNLFLHYSEEIKIISNIADSRNPI